MRWIALTLGVLLAVVLVLTLVLEQAPVGPHAPNPASPSESRIAEAGRTVLARRTPQRASSGVHVEGVRTAHLPLEPPPLEGVAHRVVARFVDVSGAPIAGVTLEHGTEAGRDVARADANGSVRLDVHLAQEADAKDVVRLLARHAAFGTRELNVSPRADATSWLGDVLLLAGGSIAGQLVGVGAADAEVRVYLGAPRKIRRRWLPWGHKDVMRSAPDGSFRIDGLLPREYSMAVISRDGFTGASEPVAVSAGGVARLAPIEIAVRDFVDSIEGRVVGADGELAEGVCAQWIALENMGQRRPSRRDLELRADGTYTLELEEPVSVRVTARIPGRTGPIESAELLPGTRNALLRLPVERDPVERDVEVWVHDRDGVPVGGASLVVRLVREDGVASGKEPSWGSSRTAPEYGELRTDAEGRIGFPEPGQAYQVRLTGDWLGSSEVLLPGTAETVELTAYRHGSRAKLAETAGLHDVKRAGFAGRVVLNGRAVVGARVTAHNASPPGRYKRGHLFGLGHDWLRGFEPYEDIEQERMRSLQVAVRPFAVLARGEAAAEHETDAAGEFFHPAGDVRAAGPWIAFRAEWNGHASELIGPFERAAGGAQEIVLELRPTGSIAGIVRTARGVSPRGMVVGVSRGDGVCRTATVGPDGAFHVTKLPAGPWQVRAAPRLRAREFELHARGGDPQASTKGIAWDCVVRPGAASWYELDLSARSELLGTVNVEGRSAVGWRVRALARGDEAAFTTSAIAEREVAGDGSFAFSFVDAASLWIELSGDGFSSWTPVELKRGLNELTIAFETAPLVWESERPQRVVARWGEAAGARGSCSPAQGSGGLRSEFGAVPVGPVQIVHLPIRFPSNCVMGKYSRRPEFGEPRRPLPAERPLAAGGLTWYDLDTVVGELVLRTGGVRIASAMGDPPEQRLEEPVGATTTPSGAEHYFPE